MVGMGGVGESKNRRRQVLRGAQNDKKERQEQKKKQIPRGNDRKKGECKNSGKGKCFDAKVAKKSAKLRYGVLG